MTLSTILKVLGVKITPEQVAELELVIPQIPSRAAQLINYVNNSVGDVSMKLSGIMEAQIALQRANQDFQDLLGKVSISVIERLGYIETDLQEVKRSQALTIQRLDDLQTTADLLVALCSEDENIRAAGIGATQERAAKLGLSEFPERLTLIEPVQHPVGRIPDVNGSGGLGGNGGD
jgi:hypothetical protein